MKIKNVLCRNLTALLILVGFAEISPVFSAGFQINLASPATLKNWRSLQSLDDASLTQTWTRHNNKGKGLGHFHWTWRLGWLHACAKSNASICPAIYAAGLKDDAMVVRTKTVQIIGKRYEQRSDKTLLTSLEKTFSDKRNFRKGQSLRVQRDVLYALKKLGGTEAHDLSIRLTKKDPELRDYVEKLHKKAI